MQNSKFLWAASLTCALLTACGGGSDATDAPATTPASTDYSTKYVGTWKSACEQNSDITDLTTNGGANATQSMTLTRTSDSALRGTLTITVYASTDTSCTGTALGTLVWSDTDTSSVSQSASGISSGSGVSFTIDGQTTLGGKTADKITSKIGALAPGLGSNATMSMGSKFSISTADFLAVTWKDLAYLNGSTITAGDDSGSATAYPTALDTTPTWTKQ